MSSNLNLEDSPLSLTVINKSRFCVYMTPLMSQINLKPFSKVSRFKSIPELWLVWSCSSISTVLAFLGYCYLNVTIYYTRYHHDGLILKMDGFHLPLHRIYSPITCSWKFSRFGVVCCFALMSLSIALTLLYRCSCQPGFAIRPTLHLSLKVLLLLLSLFFCSHHQWVSMCFSVVKYLFVLEACHFDYG